MIDEQRLRSGLQKLLKETESAIRDRLEDEPSLQAQLNDRHDAAVRAAVSYTHLTLPTNREV